MQHPRKSPRASWLDYNEGTYFVTICTADKKHFFGTIIKGQMILSDIGRIIQEELEHPQRHHKHIEIPLFIVMPNHIHAIIIVNSPDKDILLPQNADERCLPGYVDAARRVPTIGRNIPLLSTYIGALKAAVTKEARTIDQTFGWQSRFHDHAIRNKEERNNIAAYIRTNVARWASDCFFTQN